LHTGIPSKRAHERDTAIERRVADGVAQPPPERLLAEELVGVGRHRIRPQRRQVLIRQGIANEGIVAGIGPSGKRAECRRYPARVDVDVPVGPRPKTHVERVGDNAADVLRAHLAKQREVTARCYRAGDVDPQRPQRGVIIIGVVEEAGVLAAERSRHISANRDAPAAEHQRLRWDLGGRASGADEAQQQGDHGPERHADPRIIVASEPRRRFPSRRNP
jgi:hypothetical protein